VSTRVDLHLNEGNDEVLAISIRPEVVGEDLTTITALQLYLKADLCQDDAAAELVLTTADPDQITITSQTADLITATALIPGLHGSYDRHWRVDGLAGLARRTAMHGLITVEPL
jgi:hypothetical protein